MHSLADTLWTLVRWTVPVTVAAVVAAGAIGSSRVGEEIRSRVEARLAEEFPTLTVQVQGASLVQGEGIIVRGVSLVDPKMPQQWRQLLWIDELRLACTTNLTELASGPPRITAVQVRRPVVHAVRHAADDDSLPLHEARALHLHGERGKLLRQPGFDAAPDLFAHPARPD
ncbi:MAG: hypothetical protein ACK48M_04390, partial [Planctomycetia bacterium]